MVIRILKSLFKKRKANRKNVSLSPSKEGENEIVLETYHPTQVNPYRSPKQSVPKLVFTNEVEESKSDTESINLTINKSVNATHCKSFNVKKGKQLKQEFEYELFDTVRNKNLGTFPSIFKVSKRLSVYPKTIKAHLQYKYGSKHDKKNLDNILFRQNIRITKKAK